MTMKATIRWDGEVRFTGESENGGPLAIEGPPEAGVGGDGIRPMALMLLGVGGCTSYDVVNILRKGRQQVTDCVTEIEGERADTDPRVFTRIHMTFRVTGRQLDRRKVERAIRLTSEKYCSASILLERGGVEVTHEYELIEASSSEARRPEDLAGESADAGVPSEALKSATPGTRHASLPGTMARPPMAGMHHVALHARQFERTVAFYRDLLGMRVEWQPDPDNVYLTSGRDNLAIHRADDSVAGGGQRLDHIGFIIDDPADVDRWHGFLAGHGVEADAPPRTHRDGARSFYCHDPEGTTVQIIHHPPLSSGAHDG